MTMQRRIRALVAATVPNPWRPVGVLPVVLACGLLLVGNRSVLAQAGGDDESGDWRAGVAVAVITPTKSMMLAGFGSRTKPSEGTATELHAKALALQDSRGTRLVLVTTALNGNPRPLLA